MSGSPKLILHCLEQTFVNWESKKNCSMVNNSWSIDELSIHYIQRPMRLAGLHGKRLKTCATDNSLNKKKILYVYTLYVVICVQQMIQTSSFIFLMAKLNINKIWVTYWYHSMVKAMKWHSANIHRLWLTKFASKHM